MKSLLDNAGCIFAAIAMALGASHVGMAQTGVKPGNMSSVYQHAPPSAGQYQPSVTRGNSNEYHAPRPETGVAPSHPHVRRYAQRTETDLTARRINRGVAARQHALRLTAQKRAKKFTRSGARRSR